MARPRLRAWEHGLGALATPLMNTLSEKKAGIGTCAVTSLILNFPVKDGGLEPVISKAPFLTLV